MSEHFSVDIGTTQVENTRGLECRKCGCRHFYVIYTRRGTGGKLIRRRECRHCSKRFTTWEKEVGR